jgi:Fe-Mn family superoxide dismutase
VDKRTFLKSVLLASAGVFSLGFFSAVKAAAKGKKWNGIYKLPVLPYSYWALEPFIDAETMKLHHLQHHAAYTNNLNALLLKAGLVGKTTHQMLRESRKYTEDIIFNAGGYTNHRLFWSILAPAKGSKPSPQLNSAIEKDFDSMDDFKARFESAAKSVFGSGWAWLIIDSAGHLSITSTQNHDNPLMESADMRGMPLLCLDVWEHAYYMKNQNRRADYIGSFWNVVNWDAVSKRYERLKDKNHLWRS